MAVSTGLIKARINSDHIAYLREKSGGRPLDAQPAYKAKIFQALRAWDLVEQSDDGPVLTERGQEIYAWAVKDNRTGAV